eukprot:TRINITY_DN15085_c0_g1_i1.p1 TRINITY_DN15085_c0_g1~~TRINITY_DN15085_c0_g1_i1.p1  ORF type:complete len:164 (-),score=41.64 TRINITY_DN15085_c0_g1_i1:87-578(-)
MEKSPLASVEHFKHYFGPQYLFDDFSLETFKSFFPKALRDSPSILELHKLFQLHRKKIRKKLQENIETEFQSYEEKVLETLALVENLDDLKEKEKLCKREEKKLKKECQELNEELEAFCEQLDEVLSQTKRKKVALEEAPTLERLTEEIIDLLEKENTSDQGE